jgi:hypothetical protein
VGYRVSHLHWLVFHHLALGPVHKVLWLVRIRLSLSITVDIGQQRAGGAVAEIGDLIPEWLQLVVGQPFGEFIAADFDLGLPDRLA